MQWGNQTKLDLSRLYHLVWSWMLWSNKAKLPLELQQERALESKLFFIWDSLTHASIKVQVHTYAVHCRGPMRYILKIRCFLTQQSMQLLVAVVISHFTWSRRRTRVWSSTNQSGPTSPPMVERPARAMSEQGQPSSFKKPLETQSTQEPLLS